MRLLLRFLLKFKTLFFFIVLEILALALVVNHNRFQRVRFLNAANVVSGTCYEYTSACYRYFSLSSVNQSLADENAELKRQNAMLRSQVNAYRYDTTFTNRSEMAAQRHFVFRTAKVVQASTNLTHNYLTIDKGTHDGVRKGMGVINDKGVVGIVSDASHHFSVVLPIINAASRINAKVAGKSEVGTLFWNGGDVRQAQLEEVPHYIPVQVGDTIRSSAYSSVFPEGVMVGKVVAKEARKDNFYSLTVDLSVDFEKLTFVDVVEFLHAEEKAELEREEVKE